MYSAGHAIRGNEPQGLNLNRKPQRPSGERDRTGGSFSQSDPGEGLRSAVELRHERLLTGLDVTSHVVLGSDAVLGDDQFEDGVVFAFGLE